MKPEADTKLGIAIETIGKRPINGLRHPPEKGTNGWYIWFGEDFSEKGDFFKPVCMDHAGNYLSEDILDILCLEPGFRFLSANDYLDIWFDKNLLNS